MLQKRLCEREILQRIQQGQCGQCCNENICGWNVTQIIEQFNAAVKDDPKLAVVQEDRQMSHVTGFAEHGRKSAQQRTLHIVSIVTRYQSHDSDLPAMCRRPLKGGQHRADREQESSFFAWEQSCFTPLTMQYWAVS